jgi:hypothetical protein
MFFQQSLLISTRDRRREKSCVKYERVCNVNDHGGTIRLSACNRKSSGILDLLEERLDQ